MILPFSGKAITITGENPDVNWRFSSGFWSETPVPNSSPQFVAAGYDLSSIGWLYVPQDGGRVKHTTLIAPIFSANATHYSFQPGNAVEFFSRSGELVKNQVAANTLAFGDATLTRYSRAFTADDQVSVIRILDISSLNYVNQPALIVGSQGNAVPGGVSIGTEFATSRVWWIYNNYTWLYSNSHDRSLSFKELQTGDSGSPTLVPYKGAVTLFGTVTGAGASGPTYTPTAMTGTTNAVLAGYGYALKFTIYDMPSDAANTANVWTGSAGSGNFFTADNWSQGTAPGNQPVVFDSGSNGGQSAVTLNTNHSLRGMLFRASNETEGFAFNGSGTLTIGSTGIRNEDAKTQVFNLAIAMAGSQNWEAANGNLEFNGNIDNTGYLTVVGGAKDTTISGTIAGTGGLAKDDAGTLTLKAVNTYTGKTFIHNGTVKTEISGALASQTTVVFDAGNSGAALDIGNTTQTISNLVSQTGGRGVVSLNGGTLTAGAGGSTVYAGSFTGTGTVIKVGAGTWRLQGDSSEYTGRFDLQAGRFELESKYAIGTGQQTMVAQGARLQTVDRSLNVAGGARFTATQNGTSTLTAGIEGHSLTSSGANAVVKYDGPITLDRQGAGSGLVLYRFTNAGTGTAGIEFSDGVSTSGNSLGGINLEASTLYASNGRIEFSGKITDQGGPALQMIAAGTGKLILSNSEGNTYVRGTSAWGSSTILVNNETGSGTGSGSINFNTAATNATTLGGTGRMAPQGAAGLTMGSGATLAPGSGGAGFLTMDMAGTSGKATFLSGAKFRFDLGADSDQMIFEGTSGGDVLFNNNTIDFVLAEGFVPGLFTLFTFDTAGAFSGNLQIGTGLEAYQGSSLVYSANAVQLLVVPEPSSSFLLATGLGFAFSFRRRRKTSTRNIR